MDLNASETWGECTLYASQVSPQVTKALDESLHGAEIRSKIIGGFPPKIHKNRNKV